VHSGLHPFDYGSSVTSYRNFGIPLPEESSFMRNPDDIDSDGESVGRIMSNRSERLIGERITENEPRYAREFWCHVPEGRVLFLVLGAAVDWPRPFPRALTSSVASIYDFIYRVDHMLIVFILFCVGDVSSAYWLVTSLLIEDPENRLNIRGALNSTWVISDLFELDRLYQKKVSRSRPAPAPVFPEEDELW